MSISSSTQTATASSIAGASKTLFAPLERTKLMIQTQIGKPQPSSTLQFLFRIAQESGLHGLFKGNLTNLIQNVPRQALSFALKDSLNKLFPHYSPENEFLKFSMVQLGAAGLASSVSLSLFHPLQVARMKRFELHGFYGRPNISLFEMMKTIYRGPMGGFKGLYHQFGSTMAIVPYSTLYLGLFDILKEAKSVLPTSLSSSTELLNKNQQSSKLTSSLMDLGYKLVIANLTVVTAILATYPIETVRRRMVSSSHPPQQNALDCLVKIVRNEGGIKALYKGAGYACLFRVSNYQAALSLVLYDQLQQRYRCK